MQTNRLSVGVLIVGCSTSLFSLIEIKISRPYKELKRGSHLLSGYEAQLIERYEIILKSVSIGVCLLGVGLVYWRLIG